MQPSTGQTAMHCGESNWPSHSVHFFGSMTKVPPFSRMATFGHSGSQAEQPVQVEAMILRALMVSWAKGWGGRKMSSGQAGTQAASAAAPPV
jgi:hypothetical protein